MASVNKVIVIGNLGKDPKIRYMSNGDAVITITQIIADSMQMLGSEPGRSEQNDQTQISADTGNPSNKGFENMKMTFLFEMGLMRATAQRMFGNRIIIILSCISPQQDRPPQPAHFRLRSRTGGKVLTQCAIHHSFLFGRTGVFSMGGTVFY